MMKNIQIEKRYYHKLCNSLLRCPKFKTLIHIECLGIHSLRIIKYHLLFVALVMLGMQTSWQQISQIK